MSDEFELFNLETMSGVFPGSRTAQFERIRLRRLESQEGDLIWARVLWYDEPRACVVYLQARTDQDEEPLLRMYVTDPDTLPAELDAALRQAGYGLHACATCLHWRPAGCLNADQLPAGHCAWRQAGEFEPAGGGHGHSSKEASSGHLPQVISAQSSLALGCPHWVEAIEVRLLAKAGLLRPQSADETLPRAAVEKKIQEQTPRPLWGRLKKLFNPEAADKRADAGNSSPAWSAHLQEQSGVGAGTEPCLACQGRIANLGSHLTRTAEGDQQTFSVWRCRRCHTLYLNQWIDRWARRDNLETVERYYRLVPAEAATLLAHIEQKSDDKTFKSILTTRPPLSEQVKQGR